ncbi:MAG TPA: anti-sigma factor domain-containing protein [Bacillota bacterium]|nr:anti-sigma factor domain-containing protein [Bacillota bacterium]HQD42133.1 anti-sigma factor domain-containing protein [Bacillota bacterium]
MPKGVIMSISGREAVILTRDSDFVKVMLPEGEYDIGQEIDTAETKQSFISRWLVSRSRRLTVAAAVLIIAVILPVAAATISINNAVYAYVTLDINPSTEFSINGREKIIKAKPLNEEGALVLEGADLRGREIEYGIEYFIAKSCELGYATPGKEGAVIATTVMEKEQNTELEKKISETLEKTVEQNKLTVETGVLAATKEIKEEAEKAGVSAGKFLIALQAKEEQLEVDMEDVKKSSITSAINKAGGDLPSIIRKARKTREELEELLEKNREKLKAERDRDNNGREKDGKRSGDIEERENSNRNQKNNRNDKNNKSIGRDSKQDRNDSRAGNRDNDKRSDDKRDSGNNGKRKEDRDSDRRNEEDRDSGKKDRSNNGARDNGREKDERHGKDNAKGKGDDRNTSKKENPGKNKDQQNDDDKAKVSRPAENKIPGMVRDILKGLFDKNRLPR